MNGPDDDDIRERLNSLFDDEPPMASVAGDDLARGRQLVRRRRRSAIVATATALPAVLVGGWAVSTAGLGSSGSATLQPADGTGPTDAGDDGTVTVCWVAPATPAPDDGGTTTSPKWPSPTTSAAGEDAPPTVEPTPGEPAQCEAVPWGADDCSTSFALTVPGDSTAVGSSSMGSQGRSQSNPDKSGGVNSVPDANSNGGTNELEQGYTLLVPPGGLGDATAGTVGFVCDGLGTILQQHADPTGEHGGTMASGSAHATTGDGPESESASMGWADGDREGQVTLAVSPTPGSSDCLSPDIESGPGVTCDARTLDDGTEVFVGHGSEDGATRVSVEYDRPDGTTVWAIADEATDAWWHGDHGTDALTAPPMTVDDLISMALDKDIK